MPLTNYRITDLSSFLEVTAEPRQLSGLYFYQVLDCLVDLTYRISIDFRKRPQLYRDLGGQPLALALAELNAKYGTDVEILSGAERNEIYLPLFGASDAASTNSNSGFSRLRRDLLKSASEYARGALERGAPMLREAVRIAHRPLRDYLVGLHGDSVMFSKEVALAGLTERICYPVLRRHEIAAIFGVANLKELQYPYAMDPAHDILIEQIARHLPGPADTSQSYITPTRERISTLQVVALTGAEAIATVIEFRDGHDTVDADFDLLISKCFIWGRALESLGGTPGTLQPPTQQSSAATSPSSTSSSSRAS